MGKYSSLQGHVNELKVRRENLCFHHCRLVDMTLLSNAGPLERVDFLSSAKMAYFVRLKCW
jgi:hypothetical protein